ncbi:MAG: hypothetical protein KFBDDELM_00143 [Candidatus Argoarchaeum ethanivorans]|uniref:Uncharacterized protein n=1 Tax=Candidatus Argoarchaeum ethanivorans TaxID=2608793 RepID=A0A811T6R0_9EURY|nr:MAG: hypothetical protein KFBDDELM_00143 [Candidatus Argoarchaeum ethanivorans]
MIKCGFDDMETVSFEKASTNRKKSTRYHQFITSAPDYLENSTKQARVKTLEKQIDQLVHKLYDLPPEEIAIVENFNKRE